MNIIEKYRKELIILGVIIEIILIPIIVKNLISLKNKDSNENSISNINEIEKQEFGIMVQDDSGTGYSAYSGSINDAISTGYTLNLGNSKCSDGANSTVTPSSVLSINGSTVTVKSSKTVYCTLYFDKKKTVNPLDIVASKPENLSTSIVEDMYRYQGTSSAVDNNYICFGTNDKTTCTSDAKHYMYRIIGIDTAGRMKVISEYNLVESTTGDFTYNDRSTNTTVKVSTLRCSNDICPKWNESLLFKRLNGTSNGTVKGSGSGTYSTSRPDDTATTGANSDIFVDSDEYSYLRSGDGVNGGTSASSWYSLILEYPWRYGSWVPALSTGSGLTGTVLLYYRAEIGAIDVRSYESLSPPTISVVSGKFSENTLAKIGMCYTYDVLFANCAPSASFTACSYATSWLKPTSPVATGTVSKVNCGSWWLIPTYGYPSTTDHHYYGTCANNTMTSISNTGYVRPVFYLPKTIEMEGVGTLSDPYRIVN